MLFLAISKTTFTINYIVYTFSTNSARSRIRRGSEKLFRLFLTQLRSFSIVFFSIYLLRNQFSILLLCSFCIFNCTQYFIKSYKPIIIKSQFTFTSTLFFIILSIISFASTIHITTYNKQINYFICKQYGIHVIIMVYN